MKILTVRGLTTEIWCALIKSAGAEVDFIMTAQDARLCFAGCPWIARSTTRIGTVFTTVAFAERIPWNPGTTSCAERNRSVGG